MWFALVSQVDIVRLYTCVGADYRIVQERAGWYWNHNIHDGNTNPRDPPVIVTHA